MTCDVVVYGATGLVGRRACDELDAAGAAFAIAGRDARCDRRARRLAARRSRVARTTTKPRSRARSPGARRRQLRAGGRRRADLVAALAGGRALRRRRRRSGGDARALRAARIRRAQGRAASRCSAPASTARSATGPPRGRPRTCAVTPSATRRRRRARASPRRGSPTSSRSTTVAVSYVFDDLVLSPAGQRAVFAGLHARGLAWRRDRWEAVAPAAERRRVNAGPRWAASARSASFPGGDVITRAASHRERSTSRRSRRRRAARAAQTALRLLARAMPLVPARATELLAPYDAGADEYARTQFAIVAQARRGFAAAQVVVRGRDLYPTTARIAAWCARQLVDASGRAGRHAARRASCSVPRSRCASSAAARPATFGRAAASASASRGDREHIVDPMSWQLEAEAPPAAASRRSASPAATASG